MALNKGTNSYLDVADATAYFADTLFNANWLALLIDDGAGNITDTTKQSQALVTASLQVNRYVIDTCKLGTAGVATDSGIFNGVAELALAMGSNPAIISQGKVASNIKKVGAGPASVEFFEQISTTDGRFPANVMIHLEQSACFKAPVVVAQTGTALLAGGGSFASGIKAYSHDYAIHPHVDGAVR